MHVTILLAPSAIAVLASLAAPQSTVRVSVNSTGGQGYFGESANSAISADARVVAFSSYANTLVSGDTNNASDVFVHDSVSGATSRVSLSSTGTQGDAGSSRPAVSIDGRFVAFDSLATNLVVGDGNARQDVFVRDRTTGVTTRVSVSFASGDANGPSANPSISADGRFVAFESSASDLVAGDTNGRYDVFVHDRATGQTTRVSVDSSGAQGTGGDSWNACISADGRWVAFQSDSSTLVPGDANSSYDVFVHDRGTGRTSRVSVDSLGNEGGASSTAPALSSNGRYVAFQSSASNLVAGDTNGSDDVFLHDRATGATTRVSRGALGAQSNGVSSFPAISDDGRFVAYESTATNLVAADSNFSSDVFVWERSTTRTKRVSVDSSGAEAAYVSAGAALSGDGRSISFTSWAWNLVPDDTNGYADVFVRTVASTGSHSMPVGAPLRPAVITIAFRSATGTPAWFVGSWTPGDPAPVLLMDTRLQSRRAAATR